VASINARALVGELDIDEDHLISTAEDRKRSVATQVQ
jgi:hypothetical protein